MICPKCGAFIRNDSRFCNYCGEKLNITNRQTEIPQSLKRPREESFEMEDPVEPEKPAEQDDSKQSPWVILSIILSGILVAAVSTGTYYVLRNSQRVVINPVTTASVQEDTAGSRDYEPTEEPTEPASVSEEPTEETLPPETEPPSDPSEEPGTPGETEAPYEDLEIGGIIYRVYAEYAVLLKCYTGDRVIELPAAVPNSEGTEIPLTVFADTAFASCDHLQYLKIPEGVTTILFRTFMDCPNLKEVVLPDTLISIQGNTFENTEGVTIICHAGTYAQLAAVNLGIPWREGSSVSAVIE